MSRVSQVALRSCDEAGPFTRAEAANAGMAAAAPPWKAREIVR